MVPTVEVPPTIPSTAHTTERLVVLTTVAVTCCDSGNVREVLTGCTVTLTAASAFEEKKQSWRRREKKTKVRPSFIEDPSVKKSSCCFFESLDSGRGCSNGLKS